MRISPEEWPATAAQLAELFHFETEEDKEFFIRQNTPKAEGGDLVRHDGQPVSSVHELAEFLADVGMLGGCESPAVKPVDPRRLGSFILKVY